MGSASEQLRAYADLGDGNPDPALGLHNAKETKGGKPIDVEERDKQVVVGPEGGSPEPKDEKPAKKAAAKKAPAKKAAAKGKGK